MILAKLVTTVFRCEHLLLQVPTEYWYTFKTIGFNWLHLVYLIIDNLIHIKTNTQLKSFATQNIVCNNPRRTVEEGSHGIGRLINGSRRKES